MSGPLVSASAAFVAKNSRKPPYAIEQSLRFNYGEGRLIRTPASSGNRDKFTFSAWCKRTKFGTQVWLFGAGGSSNPREGLNFNNNNKLDVASNAGSPPIYNVTSSAVYRDPSAWYHVIYVYDSAQATSSDRIRIYINGDRIADLDNTTYPSQNADAQFINSTSQHTVGGVPDNLGLLDAYLAEVIFADGQALDPTDLGEYDSQNVWRPIDPSGITFGTNGFYLKFDPSATNGIGHDHSGNGNNFTPTGFTTSGTGTDVMSDTPTTNWCTLNPLQQSNDTTLSDGNLRFAGSVSKGMICGTQGAASGKYYWEFVVDDSGQDMSTGLTNLDETVLNLGSGGSVPGKNTWSWGLYMYPLNSYIRKVHNNVYTDTSATKVSNGDVIGIAYDAGAGKMWASKNNTWMDSGDPAAGTNALFTNLTGTIAPAVQPPGGGVSTTNTANFGQRAFAYTPPTGFSALNTSNLPAPDIADGSKYFDTVAYSGATSGTAGAETTQTVTGLGFSPDLVWIKNRTNANSHGWFDQVRGAVKALRSDLTSAEATTNSSGALSAFNSNGFTLANGSSGSDQAILTHQSGYTYVGWCWDAGGSGSSNTSGSITSTVSANPSAGFSIVSWTGTGNSETVGHGLGVAPSFYILKSRDNAEDWAAYFTVVDGSHDYIALNTANVKSDSAFTAPTSTVIYRGAQDANNEKMIAYCFAEVEGYSKFGSYEGNDADPGPFVYLGFKPALILLKNADASQDWVIYDTKRSTYNEAYQHLHPNTSGSENTTSNDNSLDILSNGFRPMGNFDSNDATNGPSQTIIYAAFAEHPFGGSGVSPATAR